MPRPHPRMQLASPNRSVQRQRSAPVRAAGGGLLPRRSLLPSFALNWSITITRNASSVAHPLLQASAESYDPYTYYYSYKSIEVGRGGDGDGHKGHVKQVMRETLDQVFIVGYIRSPLTLSMSVLW